jgi:xanthine/CO dehydrogenase XdhC/CoxF family maturation factor
MAKVMEKTAARSQRRRVTGSRWLREGRCCGGVAEISSAMIFPAPGVPFATESTSAEAIYWLRGENRYREMTTHRQFHDTVN